jgi:microcystin-dependent protein
MDNFIGEIRLFAGSFVIDGWAYCDGSLLQISQYDALFTLLGTTYGGDGQTTFALPDLRGRVPVHQGPLSQFGGVSYAPGEAGGSEAVTLVESQVPTHTHALAATTNKGTAATPMANIIATPPEECKLFRETTGTVALNSVEVGVAGGSLPHSNMQPFVAINYIIALAGIFPARG